jgi:catechol 2,3-dioxygenase-like lactoylglutathione lyase family enzyme
MTQIHHIALHVNDVAAAVAWYCGTFDCRISYQDPTWAMLDFENISLALVSRGEHPPHIAVADSRAERFGRLSDHRDGTRSVYIQDSSGNCVEVLDSDSVSPRPD